MSGEPEKRGKTMTKRKDYAGLKEGFGLSRGLSEEFLRACEAKDVPIEAIRRLVTPDGRWTMEALAERILADWQAEQPKLAQVFRVKVVYAIPAMGDLKRRFPAYVNPDFDGIAFTPIKVCEGVSRETREIEPEYVHLERYVSNDAALAEIDKRGLRPCLPEELIAFGDAYPEEQRKFPIVALGSGASVRGDRSVAYLWDVNGGRRLSLGSVDGVWRDDYRFLAVRK